MSNKKQYVTDAHALEDLRVKIRETEWNADIAREAIRIAERYRTKADNQRIMLNQLQRGRFQGSDLISRADAIEAITTDGTRMERLGLTRITIVEAKQKAVDLLESLPSAEAVEVVRCKDCKYHHECCRGTIPLNPDGYCSDGSRKEQNNEYQSNL